MPLTLIGLLMMAIGVVAQNKVKAIVDKYSKQRPKRGLSGEQAAREILDSHGLGQVQIEQSQWGLLSDHYDPHKAVLRLSKDVWSGVSIAAVGIAAHEAGHAIQHAESYGPLMMRSSLAPAIAIGMRVVPWIFWGGILLNLTPYRQFGIPLTLLGSVIFFGITVLSIITLPVEFDASKRAKHLLQKHNIVDRQEMPGVNAVLDSAAWTYVVGALSALLRMFLWRR